MRKQALVLEESGYSIVGPLAMNCAAPDEGNMHLLARAASTDQKERFLAPLVSGEIRSCFAMTEPLPGAGSDPRALMTSAARVSGGWRINGRKWFITGVKTADLVICVARTKGSPGDAGGATMFLVPRDAPGMVVTRNIETLDSAMLGGHGEVSFEDCFVADDSVLGEVDEGFAAAQVRLEPARLTHCMRWLGAARRARDIAIGHSIAREAFGSRLADLGMVQQMLADTEIDIAASRALILRAAWELDVQGRAPQTTAITKVFVSEAVDRIIDRAVQICGALGISNDLHLAQLYREVRPFRIYDGPSETHRWVIAKRVVKSHRERT